MVAEDTDMQACSHHMGGESKILKQSSTEHREEQGLLVGNEAIQSLDLLYKVKTGLVS